MSLYKKHRPEVIEDLVGNEATLKSVQSMMAKKERPHTFLLTGPSGCGKTTLARIMAKMLGGAGMDISEIDSSFFRGIDTSREIRRLCQFKPIESEARVWIMDECHKMTNDAQTAILKLLEDPPAHIYLILCTTDPQKLLTTIRGRCITYQMELLDETQMAKVIRRILKLEGESLQRNILQQVIEAGGGHSRNTINLLEKVLSVDEDERLEAAKSYKEAEVDAIELCRALIDRKGGWKKIQGILAQIKQQDPEGVRRLVMSYCVSILLKNDNPRAGLIMESFSKPFYDTGFPDLVFACYSVFMAE